MNKTFTLNIPEPCHEDWNKMTPQDKGRFCGSCEKVVVDFTGKSDVTIANHLRDHKKVCGRFTASQLDRPIALANKKQALIPPFAASFILPLALLATSTAYSQDSTTTTNFKSNNYVSLNIGSRSVKATKSIKGQLLDNGVPLAGVRVGVAGSNNQTQTDLNGLYRLEVTVGDVLEFRYLGFYSEQIQVNDVQDVYDIALTPDPAWLDEVVVVAQAIKREARPIICDFLVFEKQETEEDSITKKQDSIKSFIQKGVVLDDTNLPLPGANVIIDGTTRGTQADFDGNFQIEVKPGEVITFSYVGFEHKKLTITKETPSLKVIMNFSEDLILGEIIMVGYPVISYQETHPEWHPNSRESNYSVNPERLKQKKTYQNTLAIKKIQWEKKKKAKREARAARKKRK